MKNKPAAIIVLALGILQLAFIRPADQTPLCMSDTNTVNKDSVLNLIAKGDLIHWKGLPQGLTAADMSSVFTDTMKTDTVRLSGAPAVKKRYSVQGQEQPIAAWIQQDTVALLQLWTPRLTDVKLLIKNLGKPDLKIEAVQNAVIPMATQWVYSKRGITLYVNEFMKRRWSRAIPDGYIQAVSLYKPVTAEYYRDHLGGMDTRIKLRGQ